MDKTIIERSKSSIILYTFLAIMFGFIILINIVKLIRNASGPLSIITTIPLIALFVYSIAEIKWELKNPYIVLEDNSITIYKGLLFGIINFNIDQISEVEKIDDNFYKIILKDKRTYVIGLSNASKDSKNLLIPIIDNIENSLNS